MTEPPRRSSLGAGALATTVELPERWLLGLASLMVALALAGQAHGWQALPVLGAGLAMLELILGATLCVGAPLGSRAHVVVSTLLLAGLCALAADARGAGLGPLAVVSLGLAASLLSHPWPRFGAAGPGPRWLLGATLLGATACGGVWLLARSGPSGSPHWAPPLLMLLALGSGRWCHSALRPSLGPGARSGLRVVAALVLLTVVAEGLIAFERRSEALPDGWQTWLGTPADTAADTAGPSAGPAGRDEPTGGVQPPTAAALSVPATSDVPAGPELLDAAQAALRSGWTSGGGAVDIERHDDGALVRFGSESAYLRRIIEALPASGRAFRGGFWLRLPPGAPAGGKFDLLLMDERKLHRYARLVVEPTHDWSYFELEQRFPDSADDSAVTLRLGNDFSDPTASSVLVRGASLKELSP